MFEVILDTGSSDIWLAQTGYQCADVSTQAPEPESYCDFGPTYNLSPTFKQIHNEYFSIEYGDGEFLTGIFGIEHVTLAGITVKNQQVAATNYAGWYGDGVASGLVGLAFPALTNAYNGTSPIDDTLPTQMQYRPIFTNMYREGHVAPMFSLAINRNDAPGVMALGGFLPVSLVPGFASAPFQILNSTEQPSPQVGGRNTHYAISIDAITYAGSLLTIISSGTWPSPLRSPANPSQITAIVDSGTTLNYFPSAIANAINGFFQPSAQYDDDVGAYVMN